MTNKNLAKVINAAVDVLADEGDLKRLSEISISDPHETALARMLGYFLKRMRLKMKAREKNE